MRPSFGACRWMVGVDCPNSPLLLDSCTSALRKMSSFRGAPCRIRLSHRAGYARRGRGENVVHGNTSRKRFCDNVKALTLYTALIQLRNESCGDPAEATQFLSRDYQSPKPEICHSATHFPQLSVGSQCRFGFDFGVRSPMRIAFRGIISLFCRIMVEGRQPDAYNAAARSSPCRKHLRKSCLSVDPQSAVGVEPANFWSSSRQTPLFEIWRRKACQCLIGWQAYPPKLGEGMRTADSTLGTAHPQI
ncbi:uncharacterized protein BJX67DRAFT_307235 [Aspergillus lucknowensis]|uniref:Uncharacterized protein n=1 Tax=Aspergillus lucknowensis TaxID=176173 RepID=A0ABR4LZX7_9EURO